MGNKMKRFYIWLFISCFFLIVCARNLDTILGVFWHLTHSSELQYRNVQIRVERGWLPLHIEEYLSLGRYPRTETSPTITLDRRPVNVVRDFKERAGKVGRVFDGVQEVIVDGVEGIRVTTHRPNDATPYLVLIDFPSRDLSIAYQGTKEDIVVFDSFLTKVKFIE